MSPFAVNASDPLAASAESEPRAGLSADTGEIVRQESAKNSRIDNGPAATADPPVKHHELIVTQFHELLRDDQMTMRQDFSEILREDTEGLDMPKIYEQLARTATNGNDRGYGPVGPPGSLTMPFSYFQNNVRNLISSLDRHCRLIVESRSWTKIALVYANIDKIKKIEALARRLLPANERACESLMEMISDLDMRCSLAIEAAFDDSSEDPDTSARKSP